MCVAKSDAHLPMSSQPLPGSRAQRVVGRHVPVTEAQVGHWRGVMAATQPLLDSCFLVRVAIRQHHRISHHLLCADVRRLTWADMSTSDDIRLQGA